MRPLCLFSILTLAQLSYAQDGYFANWFARVDKTKDEQPQGYVSDGLFIRLPSAPKQAIGARTRPSSA